jgi:hypothetical protein
MYEGLQDQFDALFRALKKSRDISYKLDFYSPHVKSEYIRYNEESSQTVSFHKPLPANEFFQSMANSSYILVLYPDKNADFLTTKFYEIFYLKIPIIYVCKQGLVSDLITNNNLGVHLLPDELEEKLPNILKQRNMKHFNPNFDIGNYTFEKSTQNLLSHLNAASSL